MTPSTEPVIQPRRLAFWMLLCFMAAGVSTTFMTFRNGVVVMPLSALLGVFGWALYTLPLLWIFHRLGVLRTVSTPSLWLAFAWGGLGAVYLALPANQAMFGILAKTFGPGFVHDWGPAIVGPTDEETLKLMGVILVVLMAPARFRTVSSVMALGFLVGLGFQVVEDFFYTISSALNHPNANQWEPVMNMLLVRGVLCGLWSHAAYTAVASFGVGYWVANPTVPWARRLVVGVASFMVAWSLHFVWNSPFLLSLTEGGYALLYFPSKGLPVMLAALLLWRVARREGA